jgi:hypothetical protein
MTPQDDRNPLGLPGRPLRLLSVALLCMMAAGCGPGDPMESKIEANDELSLSMWRSKVERDLTVQQVHDFDQATQEIRFHIMADGTASGSDAVAEAMRKAINGQTLRHVLQQGLGWEVQRAEAERSSLEAGMKANAQMRTRPGDTDSANYLSDLHERQATRLAAATEEVRHARERLAAAAPTPSP